MTSPDFSEPNLRLQYLRKTSGFTVREFAERASVDINKLKAHLTGRNAFDADDAKKYAQAARVPGLTYLWLFLREGEDPGDAALTNARNKPVRSRPVAIGPGTALVTLREIDVSSGAGGGGQMPDAYKRGRDGSWLPTDAIKAEVMFPQSWLVSLGLDPDKTDMVRVRGDSMSPEIEDGDWIFVDRRVHRLTADDIYLIYDGFGIVVKSLAIVRASRGAHPKVRILSANPKYPMEEVPADDVRIIGRVHYRLGRIVRSR